MEYLTYQVFPHHAWGTANSAIDNPFLFTGRRLDEETGLYYYRARYLDTDQGRFISRDPIGYNGGISLYAYVGDNPVFYLDPFGEKKCVGTARVLKGNKTLIGKEGGFSGSGKKGGAEKILVTKNSAAILLEQFQKDKQEMRPLLTQYSGQIGPDPAKPIASFQGLADIIDDNKEREKTGKKPYDMWKARMEKERPGEKMILIIELPGIEKDLEVQPITLDVPDDCPCPEGTKEVTAPAPTKK